MSESALENCVGYQSFVMNTTDTGFLMTENALFQTQTSLELSLAFQVFFAMKKARAVPISGASQFRNRDSEQIRSLLCAVHAVGFI